MIIPTVKLKNTASRAWRYWVLPLALLGCLWACPSSSSDTTTSGQLLDNQGFEDSTNTTTSPNWTKKGEIYICDTCGPYGGNAMITDKTGGSLSQDIDLFDTMSQDQVNHGFELKYGADVYSHTSNATVPNCSATNGDCKDSFSITLTINDSQGNQLQKFEHSYDDISWTGWDTSTFDGFTSTVGANEWTSAIANFELYGIDKGFTGTGYGGPRFDNAHLAVTYTNQAVLDSIQAAVDAALDIAADTTQTTDTFEVNVTDNVGAEIESFSVEVNTDSSGGQEVSVVPSIEISEIRVEVPSIEIPSGGGSQTQEAQVEATVETVEAEIEAQVEVEVAETASEQQESESNDVGNSGNKNAGDAKPKSSKNSKQEKQDKKKAKQKIATKIVTKILQRMDNSAASQATQLALMNAIGANYKDTVNLTDNAAWYQSTSIYNQPQLIDPAASLFSGAQDQLMDRLIVSQY